MPRRTSTFWLRARITKLSFALNGEMALQIAARTPPGLVLLDIMMPEPIDAIDH